MVKGKQQELKGMTQAINDELSRAIENLAAANEQLIELKESRQTAIDQVVIEMKKINKDFLRISLGGILYDLEVGRTKEKLKFGKAKF